MTQPSIVEARLLRLTILNYVESFGSSERGWSWWPLRCLVETLGGPSVPAVGFAVGLEVFDDAAGTSTSRQTTVSIMSRLWRERDQLGFYFSTNSVESDFRPIVISASTLKAHLRQLID